MLFYTLWQSLCKTWVVLYCTELTEALDHLQWLTNSPIILCCFCCIFEDAPLPGRCHFRSPRWHLWLFMFRTSWRILSKRDVSSFTNHWLQMLWTDSHFPQCNFHSIHTGSAWMLVAFNYFLFQLMIVLLVFCGRCSAKSRSSLVKEWLHSMNLAWFLLFINNSLI